ncbi:CDGSH iron-sulfur domain-containing protein [Streptomyces sp. NPDC002454]|uniref:CDGSH iron-sulfur domain-containing protein n=1 Tax=unclassified Streptomyces TaxID=2593676 RepID=UPI0033193AFA
MPVSRRGEPAPRRVQLDPEGPLLVEGPVEVCTDDGRRVVSHRPVVAVCTCGRSGILPWCDTSHRRRPARRDRR